MRPSSSKVSSRDDHPSPRNGGKRSSLASPFGYGVSPRNGRVLRVFVVNNVVNNDDDDKK